MASGCILGECPVCNDHIYEDEWDLNKFDQLVHERCKNKQLHRIVIDGTVISRTNANGLIVLVIKPHDPREEG